MPLAKQHRAVLERYKRFKDEPPTVWRLMSLSVINHAAIIMTMAALFAIILATEIPSAAWFFAGVAFGTVCRDLGVFRFSVKLWPVLSFIFDWKKVDDLLSGDVDVPPT